MNTLKKCVASAFVLGVLLVQAWVIGPSRVGGYYWPFMDYPMYSAPRALGEPYRDYRLALVPPGPGSDTIRAAASELGMEYFAFQAAMEVVDRPMGQTPEESDALAQQARERVARNSQTRFGLGRFEVVLEARSYVIDRGGLISADPPWEPVESWFYDAERGVSGGDGARQP